MRVLVLYGGRSAEHEISVISARAICKALSFKKYSIVLVGIGQDGSWHFKGSDISILDHESVVERESCVVHLDCNSGDLVNQRGDVVKESGFDVVFPALHGPYGEDGSLQGLLEMANVPYVGSGVAASAVAMDKQLSRLIFEAIGLPQTQHIAINRIDWANEQPSFISRIEKEFGYPVFVKPANLGSSIGISKATNQAQLLEAFAKASFYDDKMLVEQSVDDARELECAVLGIGNSVTVSTIGEIVPGSEFYSYKAKYIDDCAELIIPANLPSEVVAAAKDFSLRAFRAIGCSGLARVDFLLGNSQRLLINEINTMPGFTPISMYPKLLAHDGIAYHDLISELVSSALEKGKIK